MSRPPLNRTPGDIAFRDPDLERRFYGLVDYAESHLDDLERIIRESNLPTLTKLIVSPLILFRRKIYREIGQALAEKSTDELRQAARNIAETNRMLWERVESLLDDADWIERLDGVIPGLPTAKDEDHD
jgi:hypothetical protein